jgi:serine protease Do
VAHYTTYFVILSGTRGNEGPRVLLVSQEAFKFQMKSRSIFPSTPCLAILLLSAIISAVSIAPASAHTSFHHHGDGYLGVGFENLTAQQREKFNVPRKEGVVIAAVDHDAPAGKAGMRSNDVIIKLDGKRAQRAEDLRDALHKMDPGQRVELLILRDGQSITFSVVLADRKTIEEQAWSQHYTVPDPASEPGFFAAVPSEIGKTFSSNGGLMSYIPGTLPYTGIVFDVMNPQLARYFGVKNSSALLVKSVDPNSPGLRAGLQAGDVISKANDAPMNSRSRWGRVLKDNRHDVIKLQILRHRQGQIVLLTLAASKS